MAWRWIPDTWSERFWMAVAFVAVALPILAVVATLFAVSADPLGLGTARDHSFDTKAACRYLNRHTSTSTPIGPDGDEDRADRVVKFYAKVTAETAARTAPGPMRRQLLASVRSARSSVWTNVEEWRSRPQQVALKSTCSPFLRVP